MAPSRHHVARGRRFVVSAVIAIVSAAPACAQTMEPVAGVWHVTGRVRATACAGRCASGRLPVDEYVTVTSAGIAAGSGLIASCAGAVSASEFEGVVTWIPGRHGWLRLRVVDRPRFRALVRRCYQWLRVSRFSASLRVSRFSARARIAADGLSLDEVGSMAGSVVVSGRTATFSVRARVHGDWAGPVASPAPAFVGDVALAGQ